MRVVFVLSLLGAVAGAETRVLPAGTVRLSRELVLRPGTHLRGAKAGTTLVAAPRFRGRALLVAAAGVTIENVTLRGNRPHYKGRPPIAPHGRTFVSFYSHNGIVAENAHGLVIRNVTLREIPNFAILIAASRRVTIEHVRIFDSGSLAASGRNNTSGGILLEEGTSEFVVRNCDLRRVRGNGVWTHSRYQSPRNGPGSIERNYFEEIGRDAIQAGHATAVVVAGNLGRRIGWPVEIVDVEGGGTPVAIDTAGNVDASEYVHNRFSEINGKCIDLDGFHHGLVSHNTCVNTGRAEDYPFGHYGIVFNNTNPDMRSEHIRVTGNTIDGTRFGGIFVIGRNHTIEGNTLKRINLAGCNESQARFGCLYDASQPDLLRAGIYLGARAERPDPASDNVVSNNRISGHGMARYCVALAPGVDGEAQKIGKNECSNSP